MAGSGFDATRKELCNPVVRERYIEFENLLAHELPRFQRMAMRWLRNREDAEDAVQDAVISAFTHIASFEGRARMSSWLMSIVINSVKMHLRKNRRKMFPLDQVMEDDTRTLAELLPAPGPTPEQSCESSQIRELVYKSIADLSPTQRVALQLFNRDGLSLKQTAEVLGVPVGTVKAQLARGRGQLTQRLRKVLGKSGSPMPGIASRAQQAMAPKPSRPRAEAGSALCPSAAIPNRWAARPEPAFG